MTAGQRNQTVVPTQTLFLLNDDLLPQTRQVLADKLLAGEASPGARLETLWLRVFNRTIAAERDDALGFLGNLKPLITTAKSRPALNSIQWCELCHSLLASNEFMFVSDRDHLDPL